MKKVVKNYIKNYVSDLINNGWTSLDISQNIKSLVLYFISELKQNGVIKRVSTVSVLNMVEYSIDIAYQLEYESETM